MPLLIYRFIRMYEAKIMLFIDDKRKVIASESLVRGLEGIAFDWNARIDS